MITLIFIKLKFKLHNKKLLNIENIELETNYKKEKNDKYFFTSYNRLSK